MASNMSNCGWLNLAGDVWRGRTKEMSIGTDCFTFMAKWRTAGLQPPPVLTCYHGRRVQPEPMRPVLPTTGNTTMIAATKYLHAFGLKNTKTCDNIVVGWQSNTCLESCAQLLCEYGGITKYVARNVRNSFDGNHMHRSKRAQLPWDSTKRLAQNVVIYWDGVTQYTSTTAQTCASELLDSDPLAVLTLHA